MVFPKAYGKHPWELHRTKAHFGGSFQWRKKQGTESSLGYPRFDLTIKCYKGVDESWFASLIS